MGRVRHDGAMDLGSGRYSVLSQASSSGLRFTGNDPDGQEPVKVAVRLL